MRWCADGGRRRAVAIRNGSRYKSPGNDPRGCAHLLIGAAGTRSLDGEWRLRGFLGDERRWARLGEPHPDWLTGHVPGCVVDDLWRAGEVPDPYRERNSRFAEWAAERSWVYQRSFVADAAWRGGRVQLRFDAVDHDARVFLNGRRIGRHRGGFTPATFEVGDRLRYDEPNLLAVLIAPAPDEESQVGDTRRVRHHLSRMTYGWDFSPRLPHQGIGRSVSLRATGPARIENLFVRARPAEPVRVTFDIDAVGATDAEIQLELNGASIGRFEQPVAEGLTRVERTIDLDLPRWWPNGMGEQPLHRLGVRVSLDGDASDEAETRFGVRSIELAPNEGGEPDALPYTFLINGRRTYVNGWNWVPLDVLYGPPRQEKLEHLLRLARRANVNLLRVWGGGLIESDDFYDRCDRLGIMVWQEFAQSSSSIVNRPSRAPAFLRLMEREARAIIPRLRNHPSLAVWGGGNELTDLDGRPLDDREPVLGALHAVVREMDPDRAWLPTSPTGREGNNSLEAIRRDPAGLHDVHGPWEHQGLGHHEDLHDAGTALFHSEFGVEGMANLETLEATIALEHRWPADRSNPVYAHRGAWWNNEPLVQGTFGGGITDLAELIRCSQYLQASGLRYAVEANRRRQWRSSGVVPWQLNEPFPNAWCTSAIGYDGRPKPAYFAVARAYEPIHLSAAFTSQALGSELDARLFGSTATDTLVGGTLEIAWFAADGTRMGPMQREVTLAPAATTRLGSIAMRSSSPIAGNLVVLELRLGGASSRYLFSTTADLAPMRSLATTRLVVERRDADDGAWDVVLRNTGEWLALLVRIEDARPYGAIGWALPGDDGLLLFPGEERTVRVDWEGVPAGERCLRIGGWNTEVITLG
jgi:beta-mannosidase